MREEGDYHMNINHMKVGFIGAGKVGSAFGLYLHKKGIKISGYLSRTKESAVRASLITESCQYDDAQMLCENSDIIMITTPDSFISRTAELLSNAAVEWNCKIVCHMSGVYSSDILSKLKERGATVCSLHPMMAFNELESSVKALESACFTLDGYGEGLVKIKNLLDRTENKYFEIPPQSKSLYHAASCTVSNYVVVLLDAGMEMFKTCGFLEKDVKELIKPIVEKVVNDVFNVGTGRALTGPISRGDTITVERHLKELKNHKKNWLEIYKALALQTAELALRANKIDNQKENEIKEVLLRYE